MTFRRVPYAIFAIVGGLVTIATVATAQSRRPGPPVRSRADMTASDSSRVRADSLQPRFGRGTIEPAALDIGQAYSYTRDELAATGALTVADLLDRIPGVTTFASGWLNAPKVVSVNGDFTRVRVFVDGVSLDDLNARDGGVYDLNTVQLWLADRLTITRGANELRVNIETWQYQGARSYTRADVGAGEPEVVQYRAFYAKRFYNGAGLQIAAQERNTTDFRAGGSGDQVSLFGRYGIARPLWSVDVAFNRTRLNRTITQRFNGLGQFLPNYRAGNTLAYVRAALGQEGSGPFLQFIAASIDWRETSSHFDSTSAAVYGFPADTVDSLTSMAQYVAVAGIDKWGGRLRFTDRYRRIRGAGYNLLGTTFDVARQRLGFSALAERDTYTGFTQLEVGGRIEPLPFVAFAGTVGQRTGIAGRTIQPNSRSARLEAGVRLFSGPWLSAGVTTRDTTLVLAPAVYDSAFRPVRTGQTTGTIASLRGPLRYGFSVDAALTHWGADRPYLPANQARVELRYFTRWLSRFPNGNFSFTLAPALEYRSQVRFPVATGVLADSSNTVSSLLAEIRILRGVISFQRRNLLGTLYEHVPGYLMTRTGTIYGVRWYFFD